MATDRVTIEPVVSSPCVTDVKPVVLYQCRYDILSNDNT
jgi:hypothetical protein